MVRWQRHLQCALRRIRRRLEHNYSLSSNYSSTSTSRLSSSLLPRERTAWYSEIVEATFCYHLIAFISVFPAIVVLYLHALGISTSRKLLAGSSEETPISSPLTPVLAIDIGKTEEKKGVANRTKVQVVLKKIKQSPKKVNLVAALIRGMRVKDALLQLQVTVKRAAKTVYQVIHSARADATHNHGLDPDRLLVAEAFIGKEMFQKRVSFHGKGRSGIKERPECRLTVVVREMTAEEEAEIARQTESKQVSQAY
ncbi:hypothetical protein Goshw_001378 [Gossypium schwendimanii]|uniref:50S ribosomal protein L22, chloroplastic n=1 Tax=Gossypium schwendimanii TaxID=34291 RepID=A0A7J9LD73_GOSSC|nr:hypothetical protein [Gossypium schwendimanii]